MKKFLVILAVMAMASLATATPVLTIELDKTEVLPGDIVTATIIQTEATPNGSGGEMTISFAGDVTGTVDLTAGFMDVPAGSWLWLFNGGIVQSDAAGGVWFSKVPNAGSETPGVGSKSAIMADYVGTVQFSFAATETTDLVWGGVWDDADMTGLVGATVTVIPEPITLALLGLGGLFIRRRK